LKNIYYTNCLKYIIADEFLFWKDKENTGLTV
jgi:hypothetical protein